MCLARARERTALVVDVRVGRTLLCCVGTPACMGMCGWKQVDPTQWVRREVPTYALATCHQVIKFGACAGAVAFFTCESQALEDQGSSATFDASTGGQSGTSEQWQLKRLTAGSPPLQHLLKQQDHTAEPEDRFLHGL